MSEEKKPKRQIKKMSEDEIKEYLKDSILIPKADWLNLPDNAQISYFKKDGGFVKSGFIKLIYNKNDEDFIRYGSKLNSGYGDKYYKEFTVNLNNIDEIWKKVDQGAVKEYQIIKNKINSSFTEYTERIQELEGKVAKLNDDNVKILKLIKKLHKLESLDDLKRQL